MPISFLVYNLTTEQANLVLQRKVWSSHAVTFRATHFTPTCPNFMFAIRGLGMISVKIVYPIVKQVWESDATKTYMQSLVDKALDDEKEKVKAELDVTISDTVSFFFYLSLTSSLIIRAGSSFSKYDITPTSL